jgi:hypothetical protein
MGAISRPAAAEAGISARKAEVLALAGEQWHVVTRTTRA